MTLTFLDIAIVFAVVALAALIVQHSVGGCDCPCADDDPGEDDD